MRNLVMLWGWSNTERTYQKFIDSAPANWKVYQISYPKLLPNGDTNQLTKNLLRFLKDSKLKKIYLMGHSLGGAFALKFAYHFPDKVEGLFLLDSSGIYDGESIFKALHNVVAHTHTTKLNTFNTYKDLFHNFKNPMFQIKLGKLAHFIDLQKEASKLNVPTIIFWGAEDMVNQLWQGEKLHKLIKRSKFIVLPKVGHDWVIHSPELFWRYIK